MLAYLGIKLGITAKIMAMPKSINGQIFGRIRSGLLSSTGGLIPFNPGLLTKNPGNPTIRISQVQGLVSMLICKCTTNLVDSACVFAQDKIVLSKAGCIHSLDWTTGLAG